MTIPAPMAHFAGLPFPATRLQSTKMRTVVVVLGLLALVALLQGASAFGDYDCGVKTCYEVLDVTRDATENDLKLSYKRLSLKYHPDKTDDPADQEIFLAVRQAFDILSNPEKREEYNDILDNPWKDPNFLRRYFDAQRVSVLPILIGVLLFATVSHWLYINHRYHELRRQLRLDPKVRLRINNLKRDRLADMIKEHSQDPEKKKQMKNKKLTIEDIPDDAISFEDIGIEMVGPYSTLPEFPRDFLLVRLAKWSTQFASYLVWLVSWTIRFDILKQQYGPAEIEYLTRTILELPEDMWNAMDEDSKQELMFRQLWIEENLEELRADQRRKYFQSKRK